MTKITVTGTGTGTIGADPLIQGTLTMAASGDGGAGVNPTADTTGHIHVPSYQTNSSIADINPGEGVRLFCMNGIAKNMVAWYMPRPLGTAATDTGDEDLKATVWIGAHYFDQNDGSTVHGHWSLETPDAGDQLRTRFEIKFCDSAGNFLDKTLIQNANADVVIDCSNSQMLRLRTGAGAEKVVEFANDQWGAAPRWRIKQNGTAESGSNAGSDLEIQRFSDAGTSTGAALTIRRSSGRVILGGTDGSQSGVDINRNSAGTALQVTTTAAGATAMTHTLADLATSRTFESKQSSLPGIAFVQYGDGKHEWGDGSAGRDTNLYRSAANVLKTDDSLHVGLDFRHLGSNLGFYNATPIAKPTVSGSRGGNAALASLLTALATQGLLTDSSTA